MKLNKIYNNEKSGDKSLDFFKNFTEQKFEKLLKKCSIYDINNKNNFQLYLIYSVEKEKRYVWNKVIV